MTTAIEAICDELTVLRRRVHCLEQANAMIRLAYEPAVTQTTPAMPPLPRRSEARGRSPRKSRRSRNATQTEVMEYVIAHGPINRRELVTALGGSPAMISQKLSSYSTMVRSEPTGPRAHVDIRHQMYSGLGQRSRRTGKHPCHPRPSAASIPCTTRSSTSTEPLPSSLGSRRACRRASSSSRVDDLYNSDSFSSQRPEGLVCGSQRDRRSAVMPHETQ